ncbi:protein TolQ [Acinetobacter indicus]|jgi:biopolymer transport protein TolQ|uniref:Protein TolQ n=1 Tax=Acinetobacter indicus TaxID=756892 RepID=A0A6C0Y2P7_9GAMM|nr:MULTISPECIES: protein TolQ [Acinetobacter]MCO8107342.1 protein TolQ [Acinetobacter indicus]MDM1263393.1 protein TolQ [Acinetobacter indicus]MDM1276709.1 protein TolQ [Acinetobacter indicus]MDM1304032.1 protein TolQ [Acinetobacter indicus]MDM1492327.1 protein TolQ [Acinetobacter indicus]
MSNPSAAQLSVWELISHASLLVQAVMLILLLASIISWYVIIKQSIRLRQETAANKVFLSQFRQQPFPLATTEPSEPKSGGLGQIYQAGLDEFHTLQHTSTRLSSAAVTDQVERRLLTSVSEQEEKLEKHLSFLATVGSVSPYIGLFGTVWGIMNSFIGLSQLEQATLSAVAPGIAEALIATAIGLFAAIPAVIAYNRLSARAEKISNSYYSFGNELQTRMLRFLQAGN